MTDNTLRKLVVQPRTGIKGLFNCYPDLFDNGGDIPLTESSYWVLMTRDVIPGSRSKSFAEQIALIPAGTDYQVPKFLEAFICISAQNVSSQPHAFTRNPWTCTRCEETLGEFRLNVGGLAAFPCGLDAHFSPEDACDRHGLALLRKF